MLLSLSVSEPTTAGKPPAVIVLVAPYKLATPQTNPVGQLTGDATVSGTIGRLLVVPSAGNDATGQAGLSPQVVNVSATPTPSFIIKYSYDSTATYTSSRPRGDDKRSVPGPSLAESN